MSTGIESLTGLIKTGQEILFYKSTAWRKKRSEILERDNNECQHCKEEGKVTNADCVHHIKHLKDRPDLALEDDNLTSLCNSCHNVEHPEKLQRQEQSEKFTNEERWE